MVFLFMSVAVTVTVCGSSAYGTSTGVPASVTSSVEAAQKVPAIDLKPLPRKPPSGKTIVDLEIPAEAVQVQGAAIVAKAAHALGWSVSDISYDGTPDSLDSGFQQAIAEKPTAIFITGVEPNQITPLLAQTKKDGILVFDDGAATTPTGPTGNGLDGVVIGSSYYKLQGKLEADWIIEKSHGKANVAVFNLTLYHVLTIADQAFEAELKAKCPGCSSHTVDLQVSDIGTDVPQIAVSTIQANPSVNYALFAFAALLPGVSSAFATAGLQKVQVVSVSPVASDFDALRADTESMEINIPTQVEYTMVVDAIARYLETKKVVQENPPIQIIDQANVPSSGVPASAPPNAQQLIIKKIWHAG
jgi:ribose transport system substrate-binding protein